MARKRPGGAKPKPEDWPADIFWISPAGKVYSVIGHLTAIQANPDRYGFDRAPSTPDEIDKAFGVLFEDGWVRGRFSGGTFSFQMDRPRGLPMGNAHAMVLVYEEHAEKVDVDYWLPGFGGYGQEMSARDFLDLKFPASWGLGSAEPR